MKTFSHYILLGLVLFTSACKYEYLTDDGVHDPHVNMTTYDFLKSHSWQSFDTVVAMIDHYQLKEEVNSAGTFLAFTDYSVRKTIQAHMGWNLDSLMKHTTADSLRNYIFKDKIEWEGLKPKSNFYTNVTGQRFDFFMELQTDLVYTEWTNQPVYRLRPALIRGTPDTQLPEPPTEPGEFDRSNYCQTTNIKTTTGIVHALENLHSLNF